MILLFKIISQISFQALIFKIKQYTNLNANYNEIIQVNLLIENNLNFTQSNNLNLTQFVFTLIQNIDQNINKTDQIDR